MEKTKINHLAVWVCIILAHGIGFAWYGALFAESWQELSGVDPEANPGTAAHWITNFIATLVPVYTLAWLFTKLDVDSGIKGAMYALIISFAFTLLTEMTTGMFEGNAYGLAWINGGSSIVVMVVTGFILGAWRKSA